MRRILDAFSAWAFALSVALRDLVDDLGFGGSLGSHLAAEIRKLTRGPPSLGVGGIELELLSFEVRDSLCIV